MPAWYNEIDPYAAQWLRNLIAAGHIAPGDVDERSIEDVSPDDLRGYSQCHFFAGLGIWSHALRLAGWPDDRPVWTGSCPCQPFSAAGKGGGVDDKRHLWPDWHYLITKCRPVQILGEQVASKDGLGWLDLVQADLEATGYASGALDLCAAGVGAPHIRQRLWFVAEGLEQPACDGREERRAEPGGRGAVARCGVIGLADMRSAGLPKRECDGRIQRETLEPQPREASIGTGDVGRMADTERNGRNGSGQSGRGEPANSGGGDIFGQPGPTNGFWRDADWLFCRDGKWRPVEPRTFPLAHGVTNRVGKLRAFGNGIVAPQAAEFVAAVMECSPDAE